MIRQGDTSQLFRFVEQLLKGRAREPLAKSSLRSDARLNKMRRSSSGHAGIELSVGCACAAPVILVMLNFGTMVLAHTANEYLAKTAARAAASAVDSSGKGSAQLAQAAAQKIVSGFKTSSLLSKPTLEFVSFDSQVLVGSASSSSQPAAGQICVRTTLTVTPPARIPGLCDTTSFTARCFEPIVSLPASQS